MKKMINLYEKIKKLILWFFAFSIEKSLKFIEKTNLTSEQFEQLKTTFVNQAKKHEKK